MKTIFRIARLELSVLFFSPIAWVVLVIFIIQSGLTFVELLENFERFQRLGNQLYALTERIFAADFRGFFKSVQSNLYLYLPLLTMGLMSRELSSGSIKLLFSSPITVTEIVAGKFLAIISYGFMLVVILLLFAGVGYFAIENMDVKLVLTGIFGLYLLICAYSAIGLFMSCLTSYQVVAAIATLVVFAALNYVGGLGQHIDIVRDITYFLSIAGRTDEFIGGLISSKDVIYFVIVILLFLAFSILRLQSGRESKPVLVTVARYSSIVTVALVIGYVSSRPHFVGYYDATETKTQSLAVSSQQVVSKIQAPLKLTAYVNLVDQNATSVLPFNRISDIRHFEKYIRFLPDLEMSYVYYYDSLQGGVVYGDNPGLTNKALAEKVATVFKLNPALILPPEEVKKHIDLSPEGHRVVRQFEYDGKKAFLRFYNDVVKQPSEKEITAAIKTLVDGPAKVAFLAGKAERSIQRSGDREYKVVTTEQTFRSSLINQGFEVDTVSLQGQALPTDIAVLIIADPRTPFTETELSGIKAYVEQGGNLFILGEPGRQSLLNPLTTMFGVRLMNGMIVQQSQDFEPSFVMGEVPKPAAGYPQALNALHEKGSRVSMQGVASLHYVDSGMFKVTPLLLSHGTDTWNTSTIPDPEMSKVTYEPSKGDEKRALPLVLGLTRQHRGKEQRIVITGDADFVNNAEIFRRNPPVYNFVFAMELFRWFTYGEYPIDTNRPETADNKLLLQDGGTTWLKVLFIAILPGILIGTGSTLLIVRRKR
jgi:ABC-2 type transport system permease protein